MKSNLDSLNGQPHSTRPNRARTSCRDRPLLEITVDGQKPRVVDPMTIDAAGWQMLQQMLSNTPGSVVLKAIYLAKWSDESRYCMFRLVRDLGDRCSLAVRGKTYHDPFEAILAAMSKRRCLRAQRQELRAAIEAAALFHGGMPDAAAKQINDRLAEIGRAKVNHATLAKQIRGLLGVERGQPDIDAYTATRMFRDHLADSNKVGDFQAVLRYFQGDFYVWRGKAWHRLNDKNFEAQVMAYLQTLEIPKLTERFAKDVLAHLRGITNLRCWNEPMPFLVVSEAPLTIERPRLIVFENGVIDLDRMLTDSDQNLLEPDARFFNEVLLPYSFDPEAKCPLWIATLKDILPKTCIGDCRQLILQEFMG